jgi:hypothetical protein
MFHYATLYLIIFYFIAFGLLCKKIIIKLNLLLYIKKIQIFGMTFHYSYLTLKKTINKKSNQLYIKKIQIFWVTISLFLFCSPIKLLTKKVTTNYGLLFFNKYLYNKTCYNKYSFTIYILQ